MPIWPEYTEYLDHSPSLPSAFSHLMRCPNRRENPSIRREGGLHQGSRRYHSSFRQPRCFPDAPSEPLMRPVPEMDMWTGASDSSSAVARRPTAGTLSYLTRAGPSANHPPPDVLGPVGPAMFATIKVPHYKTSTDEMTRQVHAAPTLPSPLHPELTPPSCQYVSPCTVIVLPLEVGQSSVAISACRPEPVVVVVASLDIAKCTATVGAGVRTANSEIPSRVYGRHAVAPFVTA